MNTILGINLGKFNRWWTFWVKLRYSFAMETKYVSAIFEAGRLRPLEPLDLREHEQVEVAIVRAVASAESAEDYVSEIVDEADSTVTLQQVQQALAKIPGSLVEDFARER
jgi:predicted DNA-binding antitoxin AbrB/MazE fold protein